MIINNLIKGLSMKVRIKAGTIVKEHKTGSHYVWNDPDKIFDITNLGEATLESEGYSGECAISANWDNLVVEDESETILE